MKRCIIIIICLMMFVCAVQAESLDFDSMSFDELLDLQGRVNQALFSKLEWKEVEIPMGCWDVGKDIPAGRYEFFAGPNATKYNYPHVVYYLERHENGSPDKIRGQYFLKNGETVVLELFDGNIIGINDCSVMLRRYVPSFSFE